MRETLTAVYVPGTVGIDDRLYLGVIVMTDQDTTRLRDRVRARYAEAARAVLEPEAGVAPSCCGSSATDSCCGAGSAAAEAVGGFRKGEIEALPLPDTSVDVVISNCVINLSTDKPAVLAEMFRVLVPGGRIGITDVVAEDHMTPADRMAAGSYVGCIAGALTRTEYLDGLAVAGFADASVTFTTEAAPGMHSAIIRAVKPAGP